MATLLRFAATVICSIIVLGFLTFAMDESDRASRQQVSAVDPARGEAAREKSAGPVKEALSDANDFLLAPFDNVTNSRNAWVQHLVPTGLGLLLYGLGFTVLANYLPKPKRPQAGWRAA